MVDRKVMMKEVTISEIIAFEEGFRARPYLCSESFCTVGYGLKLSKTPITEAELDKYYAFELSQEAAFEDLCSKLEDKHEMLMNGDLLVCQAYKNADDARRCALLNMIYQMGIVGVDKFRNMLMAIMANDNSKAADEALDSRWARQTPARAGRVSRLIRTGDFGEYDELCD